jgi:hypothetical protein
MAYAPKRILRRQPVSRPVFGGVLGNRSCRRVNAGIAPWIFYFSGVSAGHRHGGDGDLGLREQSEMDDGTGSDATARARRRWAFVCAGFLAGLALAGCGTISDETAGRAMMAPGRYDVYPCPNIEARMKDVQNRRTELEQLMARSAQSPGGEIINAMAYRSEYVQTGGDLEELARASAEKKCASDSKYTSRRTVY